MLEPCKALKVGGDRIPQGYYTSYGYMGLVNNHYMLFATYEEYLDYITE